MAALAHAGRLQRPGVRARRTGGIDDQRRDTNTAACRAI
jgi:hypothetical protein